MPANNYYTIFELGLRSFPWARIIPPLVFLVGGLLLFRLFRSRTFYVAVGLFVASIASIILFTSLVIFIPKFVALRSAYVSGKGIVVEGIVQNFHPAPTIGPASESFSVQGIHSHTTRWTPLPVFTMLLSTTGPFVTDCRSGFTTTTAAFNVLTPRKASNARRTRKMPVAPSLSRYLRQDGNLAGCPLSLSRTCLLRLPHRSRFHCATSG